MVRPFRSASQGPLDSALPGLEAIYDDVDRRAGKLAAHHAKRLQCRRGCVDCCVDDITVFEIEAENIRRHHSSLLEHGTPNPQGQCAFLSPDGACRIYEQRPYVCRTQGLPLRWTEEDPAGRRYELRDICPLNVEGTPIEQLAPEMCWTLGPVEGQLAQLQAAVTNGDLRRVGLRSLFAQP